MVYWLNKSQILTSPSFAFGVSGHLDFVLECQDIWMLGCCLGVSGHGCFGVSGHLDVGMLFWSIRTWMFWSVRTSGCWDVVLECQDILMLGCCFGV